MNTAKHTPGPWVVNDSTENDDDTTLTICAPADDVEIATMSAYENGCECFSEIRANAHLIAAAPAMYADAKQLCELVRDFMNDNRLYDGQVIQAISNLETALSQAEGAQHE